MEMKNRYYCNEDKHPDATIRGGLAMLLCPRDSFYSISLEPLLLVDYFMDRKTLEARSFKSGCVISINTSNDNTTTTDDSTTSNHNDTNGNNSSASSVLKKILSVMQSLFVSKNHNQSELDRIITELQHLLLYQTDDCRQVLESVKRFSKATEPIVGQDEIEWFASGPSSSGNDGPNNLRYHALLRRLAMPMYVIKKTSRWNDDKNKHVVLEPLDISFLNLILQVEPLKNTIVKCLLSRIVTMEKQPPNFKRNLMKEQTMWNTLIQLLKQTVHQSGIHPASSSFSKAKVVDSKMLPLRYSRHIPNQWTKDRDNVRAERKRLLDDLRKRQSTKNLQQETIRYYTVGGKMEIPYRIYNGCLLITEKELPYEEFCRQVKLMTQVNKTLPRPFCHGESRPKLHSVPITTDTLAELRHIFFNVDGSLKKGIMDDIDLTQRHGYINFSNTSCREQRNDYRWQVPMKRHTNARFIETRSKVETWISQQRIIFPNQEKIHDMGLLIGGTEDQSLHHDIPRQTTCWLPIDPTTLATDDDTAARMIPVNGWEFDRAAYNAAMASRCAPSSVLLGMCETGEVKVGVQKNQIDKYGCEEGWCTIVDGKEGEMFQIVRENDWLVVLKACPGVMFTGDFQHAGVRNFSPGSEDDLLMMKFYDKVEGILEQAAENEEEYSDTTKDIVTMMCNFPKLNRICRFHCSTEPLEGPLRIPRNTVGFVDCRPNPPDAMTSGQFRDSSSNNSTNNKPPAVPSAMPDSNNTPTMVETDQVMSSSMSSSSSFADYI